MVTLPGLQIFGLVYKEQLKNLGITDAEISTLINTQYALGAFSGLFNGPLYSKFTFREVGLVGGVLVFIGLLSSAWCQNFIGYIMTYSVLYGLGMGVTQVSGSLALNTYFKKKRMKATGFACTIMGIGPIAFPHLATYLIGDIGYVGTVATFAGIATISILSAICYRPALQFSKGKEIESIAISVENGKPESNELLEQESQEEEIGFFRKFVRDLDLGLLKDFTFLNILIGLTVITITDLNFFVLIPFILGEAGYKNEKSALIMSILAGVDISVRFVGPFISAKLPLGNKSLFAIGIISVSIGRLIFALTTDFGLIIFACFLLGFGKALRTFLRSLIVADYVPLKKLPAASGLLLVSTAIFSFAAGPLLGLTTANYGFAVEIHVINTLAIICLSSWGIEGIVSKYAKIRKTPSDS